MKQILIYIVSESQGRENYVDLSLSLMKTIRTLRKLQRGHKNAQTNIRKYKRTRHSISFAFSAAMSVTAVAMIFPAQKGDIRAQVK